MLKVMLVDDEPYILQGLQVLIDWESGGFEIARLCSNGKEALKYLKENDVDLVISDIRMPEMSGLELLETVKKEKISDAEFVLLTGYDDFASTQKAIRNGCLDYILKPVEEEEEFINAYLQLQSYRFGDRISFNIDISKECKNILIPKLTLVTFVENACIHGIESKSTQGWIFVRVYNNADHLVIEVEDTGDGMDEKEVELLQQNMNTVTIDTIKKAKHVGILNACLRIKMMFKDQAKFSIESEKGIGMSVIIMIPSDMITTA